MNKYMISIIAAVVVCLRMCAAADMPAETPGADHTATTESISTVPSDSTGEDEIEQPENDYETPIG